MSENNTHVWHLTPRGWVSGSEVNEPDDRVLTMFCQETTQSLKCHEVWSSPTKDEIKPLILRFGAAPEKF